MTPPTGFRDRVLAWIDERPLRARDYAVFVAIGVAVRVAFAATAGLTRPIGEDLEFWAYRAIELAMGSPFGTHPPVYPAMIALLHALGLPSLGAGVAVAAVSGVALAPASAWLGDQVGGPRTGRLVGALALTWPAIVAWSVRVEPTAPFLVGTAIVLGLAAIAAREGRTRPAAVAAFGAFLLVLTKESGLVGFVPVLVALALSGPGRGRRVGAALATFGIPLAAWMIAEALSAPSGVATKASLPLRDAFAYFAHGDVPAPMRVLDDPWGLVPWDWTHGRQRPGLGARIGLYAAVEALRWIRQVGLWGPVAVVASGVAFREARAGRLPAWAVGLGLAAQLPLAISAILLVQGRHAETGLLGTALLLGMLAAAPARRAKIADVSALLALQGAVFLFGPEATRAAALVPAEAEADAVAAWAASTLPPGTPMCTVSYRLSVALERPGRDCWDRGRVPPGPFYAVVNQESELDMLGDVRPLRTISTFNVENGSPWLLVHTRDASQGRVIRVKPGATPDSRPRYRSFVPR